MAWSSSELSATLLAKAAADKPLFVGQNWARSATAIKWNASGDLGDPNAADASAPVQRIADGYDWLPTYPNTTATTWYLLLNLGALRKFDAVAILGHSGLSGADVTLEVADDADFSTSLEEIYDFGTIGSDITRLIALDLMHTGSNARAYEAQYVRIKFAKGSAFTPAVREVFIGSRRQMPRNPNLPYDEHSRRSTVTTFVAGNRMRTDYVLARGQYILSATFEPGNDSETEDIRAFFEDDLDHGVRPFLWIPSPHSAPEKAYMMKLVEPSLSMPLTSFSAREWRIEAEEQGAQFVSREGS